MDFQDYFELSQLYARYAQAVSSSEWELWPEFFTEDCVYRLQPRENHDRGFPLATLSFESKGMLKDRVYGAAETIFHDPYWQRHVVGAPRILGSDERGLRCEASYVVIRTKRDAMPEILSVGRTIDRVVETAEGLRFAERHIVFDNDIVPNSIVDPI